MQELHYGLAVTLERTSFDDAILEVTAALKEEGFGVLCNIDVQQTFKDKLGQPFPRYTILGACNPVLAKRALDLDRQIGLLLPCNVVVQEDPATGVIVSAVDPRALFRLVENPAVKPVADEVRTRLQRVMASLR